MSVRFFNRSRVVRVVAGVLAGGAFVALLLQLSLSMGEGRGLVPYFTAWGLETTPVQAMVGIASSLLILGGVELAMWVRGPSARPRKLGRRARGPIRAR